MKNSKGKDATSREPKSITMNSSIDMSHLRQFKAEMDKRMDEIATQLRSQIVSQFFFPLCQPFYSS